MIYALSESRGSGEVAGLRQLAQAGVPVTATWVLEGLEEEFYALNNLPEQISRAFAGVFGIRVDEERLEAASAIAQQAVRQNYLLPERSEKLISALGLGPFAVRYAGELVFAVAPQAQEAVWAVKRLWASCWEIDAVLERSPNLAPPDRPTLIQRLPETPVLNPELSRQASLILGCETVAWTSRDVVVQLKSTTYD